ncbi:MAG TPA: hypothetical protein VGS79_22620 [Puia sp.]|nr:hypothetical protein [Puia sp.]
MNGFSQAAIQFKKFTWLALGLCFVLLYSCPVKKYLLLTYGKARADESATCQFQKDASGHCERIAYLKRTCRKCFGVVTSAVRPSTPPVLQFFSCSFSPSYDNHAVFGRAVSARNGAIAGAPPRYLEVQRLLI